MSGKMVINGRSIDLFNLKETDVLPATMVKGLQGIIRFNGYSGWSVAQHSLLLSHMVANVYDRLIDLMKKTEFEAEAKRLISFNNIPEAKAGLTKEKHIYDALIHDFSEALTGDIIRPFKKLVPEISKLETKVDQQIRRFYKAPLEMPLLVDVLDKQIASFEAYYLTRYHDKHLIDENSSEQVAHFNQVFIGENYQFIAEHVFDISLTPTTLHLPLPDDKLLNILNIIGLNFENVFYQDKNRFLVSYIDRLSKIKNLLDFKM